MKNPASNQFHHDVGSIRVSTTYRYESSVDRRPSVRLGFLSLHDVTLDRISSVVLRGFPGNDDVISVLLNTLRLAGREGLICKYNRQMKQPCLGATPYTQ
jgi:hypothetical protein